MKTGDKFLFGFLFLLLIVAILAVIRTNGGDFIIYLGAADLMLHGKSIYHTAIQTNPGYALHYSYSPVFAMLLIPLTFLPAKLVYSLWLIFNIYMVFQIIKIIKEYLSVDSFSNKNYLVFIIIILAFSTRFILYNLNMIQVNIFLLFLSLKGIELIGQNRSITGALLLSLGIIVKTIPILLLGFLFLKGRFKAIGLITAFVLILFLSPSLFIGFDSNTQLLGEWFEIINPANKEFNSAQNLYGEGVHSLSALITSLMQDSQSCYGLTLRRHIFDASDKTVFWTLNFARAFLLLLSFLFIRRPYFSGYKNNVSTFYGISFVLLISPLLFPHQQKYAFVYILPTVAYLAFYILKWNKSEIKNRKIIKILGIIAFALIVLSSDGFIGKHLYHIAQHYKLISYGTLLLIIALFLGKPPQIQEAKSIPS